MRGFAVVGVGVALLAAGAAEAAGRYDWGSPQAPGRPRGGGWSGHPTPPRTSGGHWQGGGGHWHGGGHWSGGNHVRFRRGHVLPRFWLSPTYFVPNWSSYGFAQPGLGQNWVRYYDDALLVDRNGHIYSAVEDVDWDRYDHGPVPDYDGRWDDGDLVYQDEGVTWRGDYAGRPYAPPPASFKPYSVPLAPGQNQVIQVPYGATITITQPVATTTTTTKVVYETVPARKVHRKARTKAKACNCRRSVK